MKKKTKEEEFDFENTGWAFATINNKLAEFHFNSKNKDILGHCYVKLEEYKTKREQKMIKDDIAKYKFTWRKGKYKQLPVIPATKHQKLKAPHKS